jgi:MFS family permease
LAPIAGPVVGGLILSYASWRWIFFINVPIGLAAIVLGLRFLPPTAPLRKRSRLDVRGLLLLTPGVGAVVYGLSLAASPNFGGTRALVAVVGGLGLVAAFIVHASIKGPTALLDLGLFGDKVFRAAIVTTFIVGLSIYAFGLLVPLYFQLVRGDGAFLAGIMLVPQSLGGTSVMWASALTDRMGSGRVVLIGIAIMILGAFAFTLVGVHTVYILIALALAIRGFGVGSTVVPTMAGAYVDLGPEQLPRASSTILLVQRLGGSIGTALTAAALQREITSRVTLPSSREPVLSQLAQAGHALPGLTGAFSAVFWMITGVTALAWLPALGLPRRRGAAVSGPRTESS